MNGCNTKGICKTGNFVDYFKADGSLGLLKEEDELSMLLLRLYRLQQYLAKESERRDADVGE